MATFTEEAVAANNALALAIDNIKRSIVLLQIENERLRAANVGADVTAQALRFILEHEIVAHVNPDGSRLLTRLRVGPDSRMPRMPQEIGVRVHEVLTLMELDAESVG